MQEVFAEMGFGNGTFFSTEIEEGGAENRVPKFIRPQKITGLYFRLWIGRKVLIISTRNGIEIETRDKKKFKILFGIRGEGIK